MSIAEFNNFHQQPRSYRQTYHSVNVHVYEEIPCLNYDLLLHCVTAPDSVDSQKYIHYFVQNIFIRDV